MTRRDIVLGNLDQYFRYHIIQTLGSYDESKDGTFTLSEPIPREGVWSNNVESWSVNGVTEPSIETLMTYIEDDVFKVTRAVISMKNENDFDPSFKDYKDIRDVLKSNYTESGWANYSDDIKLALSKCFLVSDANVDTILSSSEKERLSIRYHEKMRESRTRRWKVIVAYLYRAYGSTKGKTLLEYIHGKGLINGYLDGLDSLSNYFNNEGEYLLTGYDSLPLLSPNDGYTKSEILAFVNSTL